MIILSATIGKSQSWTDTCAHLKEWDNIKPFSQQEAKEQYDTLRLFIEKCAASDEYSFNVFTTINGAVQLYAPNDTFRFDHYRDWLISVLYLNMTQPYYFCSCIKSISGTYQYDKFDPTRAASSVYRYLRTIPACYGDAIERQIKGQYDYMRRHNLDTTAIPLDSLGLGFLNHTGIKNPSAPVAHEFLSSFTSSPNPFSKETTLKFILNRTAYTSVAIYDELGKVVWNAEGRSFEPGEHTFTVDSKTLSDGIYYARITTGFGEVRTVKLVKE